MCGWAADHFEAMTSGDAVAGILENSMHKLLLAHVPRRCSISHELSLRFKLSRNGQYAAFPDRIEERARVARLAAACNAAQMAKRARRMAQCGAYRKGVQSLRGQVAQLSPSQQLMVSNFLLHGAPGDPEPSLQR